MATYKIDDTTIKSPTSFETEKYIVTEAGRIADGSMIMDYVTKKRKFLFGYAVISKTDKGIIEGLLFDSIGADKIFFTLSYEEDGTTKTATVYPGALKGKKHREGLTGGEWYWKDYGFDLIEV